MVSHMSALALLAHQPDPRFGDSTVECVSLTGASVPSDEEARDVIEHLQLGIDCLDVLVSNKKKRRSSSHVKTHLFTKELPSRSFISIEYWSRSTTIYVCCPELAYLQAASASAWDAIYAGYAMTSDYRLDEAERSGVVNRLDASRDGRLTTVERIEAYLESVKGIRGQSRARALLKYVVEGSRSPRESALCMMLSLPVSYGGHAIGEAELNRSYRIRDGKNRHGGNRMIERTPDVVLTAKPDWGRPSEAERRPSSDAVLRAAIDYDSDAEHTEGDKMQRDIERRNELALLSGVAHFTVTTEIINDYRAFSGLCDRIRRALHVRKRPLFNGSYTAEQRYCKRRQVENRQIELWQFLIEEKRSW